MLNTSVITIRVRAGGKDALIGDAAVRQIAQAHLDDIGRDGGGAFHWVERQIGLGACRDGDHHGLADGAGEP